MLKALTKKRGGWIEKVLSQIRANRIWLLMVLPGVLWFLVFSYLPMFGTVIAFKDYKIDGKGFLSSIMAATGWDLKILNFYSKQTTLLLLPETLFFII